MVSWEDAEQKFPKFETEIERNALGKKIKWITFIVMSLALSNLNEIKAILVFY